MGTGVQGLKHAAKVVDDAYLDRIISAVETLEFFQNL